MDNGELLKKIRDEGNIRVIARHGVIGLILRPDYAHRTDNKQPVAFHLTAYSLIPLESRIGSILRKIGEEKINQFVDVHGGITYFKEDEENGVLWIGIDFAHGGDTSTFFQLENGQSGEYRDMEYAKKELEKLIDQLFILVCKEVLTQVIVGGGGELFNCVPNGVNEEWRGRSGGSKS